MSRIVLGAPIFSNAPLLLSLRAPCGQLAWYKAIRAEIDGGKELMFALGMEYFAIAEAMQIMGIPFRILSAHQRAQLPGIEKMLQDCGLTLELFPEVDHGVVTYPRDLATCLPGGQVLWNSDSAHTYPPKWTSNNGSICSPFGEGGSILLKNNVALVPKRLYCGLRNDRMWVRAEEMIEPLTTSGMKVVTLGNVVLFEEDYVNGVTGYGCDNHVDRTLCLIADPKGGLHVIIDPCIQSGYANPFLPPQNTVQQTVKGYRSLCERAGVHVHVPRKLQIPMSVGLMQFPDGRVLMTSGDDEVAEIVEKIIGSENLFTTSIPIKYLPVYCKAGIHCFIGEIPDCCIS